MANSYLRLKNLSFSYDEASEELFKRVELTLNNGWTAFSGPNGAGKSTLLKLICGSLSPQQGSIESPGALYYCPQRTDSPPPDFEELLYAFDGKAGKLISSLELCYDWPGRWESLSHGERKRAQIATALWKEPAVLAIDEPTNHLDVEAKEMIIRALQSFQGIGLLVSHDRALSDLLCNRTIFLDPSGLIDRPGGISRALEQLEQEELHKRREYENIRGEVKRLTSEARRRQKIADSAKGRLSKKRLDPKDHDGRAKRDLAKLTGKDGVGGKLLNQMKGRIEQSEARLKGISLKKEYKGGIKLETERSKKRFLYTGEPSTLEFQGGGSLILPRLTIQCDDRIALTGPNGGGKSTLLREIVTKSSLSADELLYLPQELTAEESEKQLREIKKLSGNILGRLMNIISRLGSLPKRLLETVEPSPGEMRKLLLALGITKNPQLIIMDEPTNHLDLHSIQALEQLLADCPCALLLVSHDTQFVEMTTEINWKVERLNKKEGSFQLKLQ